MIRKTFYAALLLALAMSGVAGDPEPAGSSSAAEPKLFGNGEKPRADYAGRTYPRNVLSLSLSQETAYDDNVFNDNALRRGDVVFGFGGRLAFRQERKRFTFAADYQPDFLVYRETSVRNAVNHGLQLDLDYQVSPRFSVRLRDSAYHSFGMFHPRSSESFLPEMGLPTMLNDTLFTPLVTTFENNLRLDAVYQMSRRTSFNFFGGMMERDFGKEPRNGRDLKDNRGLNAGFQHRYRLGRSNAIGTLLLFQQYEFGDQSQLTVQSVLATFTHQFSPATSLEIFGGPQHTRMDERITMQLVLFGLPVTLSGRYLRHRWQPALGFTFTKQHERTAVQFSGRRTVSDGAGLLTGVRSTVLMASIRRRLGARWYATLNGNFAYTSALGSQLLDSHVASSSSGLALERTLTENLSARLAYNFIHQRHGGATPLLADVDRNRVSLGVFYRLSKLALGR